MAEGNFLSNKVEIDLYMLCSLMLHWIAGEINYTDVITIDHGSSQVASATPFAMARYSASALDRETVCWRLEDQDTRLLSRNTA
jgi:hypothetical protein